MIKNMRTDTWLVKENLNHSEKFSNAIVMNENSTILIKPPRFISPNSTKSQMKKDKSLKDGEDVSSSFHEKSSTMRTSNYLRYKTELCRSFEENGSCRFGDGCTFAHGFQELRAVPRHPRYKTEPCRTYHTLGYCQYGTRCHFIHDPDEIHGVPYMRSRSRFQNDLNTSMFSLSGEGTLTNNEIIIANLWRLSALMQNDSSVHIIN